MDIVSFETAKKLKEAGFPQPAPAPGQWWGIDSEVTYISRGPVGYLTAVRYVIDKGPVIQTHCNAQDFSWSVYLPTATDILRELPGIYVCINDNKVWRAEWSGTDCYSDAIAIASGANPAEVAAAAWLSLNTKPSNDQGVKFGEWQPIQFVDVTKSKRHEAD